MRESEIGRAAAAAVDAVIVAGAERYVRRRHLPPLIGHKALILSDGEIVEALESAIAVESRKLGNGHWTADRNRLIALRQAYAAETAAVRCAEGVA